MDALVMATLDEVLPLIDLAFMRPRDEGMRQMAVPGQAVANALTPEWLTPKPLPEYNALRPSKVPAANWAPEEILTGAGLTAANLLPVGMGKAATAAALPLGIAASERLPMLKGIRAYHGSPYDFERFDISKIGTGEGAQAYGHGLYFAENEGVARGYRDNLTKSAMVNHPTLGDNIGFMRLDTNFANAAHKAAPNLSMKRAEEIGAQVTEGLRGGDDIQHMRRFVLQSDWDRNEKAAWLGALDHAAEYTTLRNPGRMYEVNIAAKPEQFLDWDRPLSAQIVRPQLEDIIRWQKVPSKNNVGTETTGGQMVNYLEQWGGKPFAANEMRDAGIPGIRYLDQGSRAAGEGSRNYVVFDDSLISILRKYGLAGLAALPAMGNALLDNRQNQ